MLYVPQKPEQWPSHIEIEDSLVDAVGKNMALNGIRMIVAHDPAQQGYSGKLLTSQGSVATYPSFTQETLDSPEFKETIAALSATSKPTNHEILVCTHGSRDCRCSDIGGDLVLALRHEVSKRGLDVKVTECAHVGGHKCVPPASPHPFLKTDGSARWAANAILLPGMTFLSNLRPTHAPLILDHLLNPSDATARSDLWRQHFRGIIGLPVETQVQAFESAVYAPKAKPVERKRLPVRFTMSDGTTHDVYGYEGESLMEIAKREELGAVEGTCGGHLGTSLPSLHGSFPY